MVLRAFVILFFAASVQAAPLCESVFADQGSLETKIAELSNLLAAVRANPHNVALGTDFRTKYLEVEADAGRSIKDDVLRSKTSADRTKSAETERRESEAEILKIWTRAESFEFPLGPSHAIYLDETTALVPQDNEILVYDLKTKRSHSLPLKGCAPSSTVGLSPDRKSVYVGSESIQKLDLQTGDAVTADAIAGGDRFEEYLSVSKSGNYLAATASQDRLTIVDARTMKTVVTMRGRRRFRAPLFSDSEKYLLVPATGKNQILFDLRIGRAIELTGITPELVDWRDAAFLPGRDVLIVAAALGRVFEYDPAMHTTKILPLPVRRFQKVVPSADGKSAFLTWKNPSDNSEELNAATFDLASGRQISLTTPKDFTFTYLVAESADRQTLAYARTDSDQENLLVVDLKDRSYLIIKVTKDLSTHIASNQPSGQFSPSGHKILLNPVNFRTPNIMEIH